MRALSFSSASSGTLAVKPCSACARTKRALGLGRTSFASSRQCTPLNDVSNRLQRLTLVVVEREGLFDLAEDLEVPRREIGLGNGAGVQDGPLLRQVLPGRESSGIEPLVDQLLLRLGSEEAHAYLH